MHFVYGSIKEKKVHFMGIFIIHQNCPKWQPLNVKQLVNLTDRAFPQNRRSWNLFQVTLFLWQKDLSSETLINRDGLGFPLPFVHATYIINPFTHHHPCVKKKQYCVI